MALAAAAGASAERMQQMKEHPRWSLRFVEQSLGTERLSKKELILYLREFASLDFLRRWKLLGTSRSLRRSRNCDDLISAFKVRLCLLVCCFTLSFVDLNPAQENHAITTCNTYLHS